MKILYVHNYYGISAPSGENNVVDAERKLLMDRGHEVADFMTRSDGIRARGILGAIQGGLATPWNPFAASALRKVVEQYHPDIVHVHNTFPLLSPAIFHAIGDRAARVLTLHNYRLFCPGAIPMRDGKVCSECMDRKTVMPAIRHGCYRNRIATVPLAINVALHRFVGTWTNHVDAFIALTEFQRQKMIECGLPADRMHVKPNFFPGMPEVIPWKERKLGAVFVGRLTPEKGVRSLISAWKMWGQDAPPLTIIGEGPLRQELQEMASGLRIEFLGQMGPEEAQAMIASARLLVLPSEWFEGFPMVIREAFAFGTPAAVSNIGPLPSIVGEGKYGLIFEPSDPGSLLNQVRNAWADQDRLERLAGGSRAAFKSLYTESANYHTLTNIYKAAMERTAIARNRYWQTKPSSAGFA